MIMSSSSTSEYIDERCGANISVNLAAWGDHTHQFFLGRLLRVHVHSNDESSLITSEYKEVKLLRGLINDDDAPN